jgi:large conductance mechanosensitive channel
MWKAFKAFALRGNMIDMAIGILLGAAFGAVVQSLVSDVLMPPIGLLIGGVDFSTLFIVLQEGAIPGPYLTLEAAREAGAVTLNVGLFLNTLISFLVVAFSVFLIAQAVTRLQPRKDEAPPLPSLQEQLLMEIRDLLKTRR